MTSQAFLTRGISTLQICLSLNSFGTVKGHVMGVPPYIGFLLLQALQWSDGKWVDEHLDGHKVGIQEKNHLQELFVFHLYNQSPIYLEYRFGLGTPSSMLWLYRIIMGEISLLSHNYSNQFDSKTALMKECLDQVQFFFQNRLGSNGTWKVLGSKFSFEGLNWVHQNKHCCNSLTLDIDDNLWCLRFMEIFQLIMLKYPCFVFDSPYF